MIAHTNPGSRHNAPDPAALLGQFETRARRHETPCGDGSLVWRSWGSGPPALLAHGAHGGWSHWIRNIESLSQVRTLWVPDLPGYGESASAPGDDHAAIAAVLASGLRRLIPSGLPLDFIGFSFGGVIGGYFAAYYPELVRRLILVGTGGLDTPIGRIETRRLRGLEGSERRAAHQANLLALMLHDPASVDELALHMQEINGARARLDPIALVLPDRLMDALPRLTVQIDAIWGEFDRPHPNPTVQEAVLRRFQPQLDFRVIRGAGHWTMYERPEEFNRAVLDLLDRPLRRA
jgi:pimeloyl-ACP methyl ester carboxylesterase